MSDTEKTRGSDTPDTDAELLLEEISAQAQREKAELEARLEGQLRDVGERTETELRRLGEEADRQLRVLLERERGALEGRRRLEEQRKRLAARRARVEAVFAEARRRVEGLRGSDRYPEALKRLIREALEQAGAGAELTVSDAEEELARRLVAELELSCVIHAREAPLGTVLARSADGLRQVDNGLTGRLDRARDTLEEEVARLLWGTTTI